MIWLNKYIKYNRLQVKCSLCLGSRWEGGGGETAQGEHQEAERCGGAAGEGAEPAADRRRGAAGEEQERPGGSGQLL